MVWRLLTLAALVAAAWAGDAPQGDPVAKAPPQQNSQAEIQVTGPEAAADGTAVYRIKCPYQRGETLLRVLAPERVEPPESRRVLFVLPVEAGAATRWGDPIRAAKAAGLADKLGFVTLLPTFSDVPWYCDHPTDPTLRQESYVLKVLVPLAEKLYPHEAKRRALIGYSKSGWGAFSLLLRNPDVFAAAASWDAPMTMPRPMFELGRIVGTAEAFERLRIPALLRKHAEAVRGAKRLALLGYGNFPKETREAHALMAELGIPHDYADGPQRKHHWESGWLEGAAKSLREMMP